MVASSSISLNLMNVASTKCDERVCSLPLLCLKPLSGPNVAKTVPLPGMMFPTIHILQIFPHILPPLFLIGAF